MTKQEFFAGWTILTAQPWGRYYRGNTPEGTIQVELYYKHVSKANPVVWQAVCEDAATGTKWPSLDELKDSLRLNGGYVQADQRAIRDQSELEWEDAPEPLSACFTYAKEHDCLLSEAYCAVLPVWMRDNADYDHAHRAQSLLSHAQKNFGMKKRGNVQVPL